jgi:hypothetical protein
MTARRLAGMFAAAPSAADGVSVPKTKLTKLTKIA